jgi:hypothetical protein
MEPNETVRQNSQECWGWAQSHEHFRPRDSQAIKQTRSLLVLIPLSLYPLWHEQGTEADGRNARLQDHTPPAHSVRPVDSNCSDCNQVKAGNFDYLRL